MTKAQQHVWSIHSYKLEVVRVSRPLLFSIPPPLGLPCLFPCPKERKLLNSPFSKTSHPPNIQSKSQSQMDFLRNLSSNNTQISSGQTLRHSFIFFLLLLPFCSTSLLPPPFHITHQHQHKDHQAFHLEVAQHCAPRRRARTRACTTARGNVHVASAQPSTRAFELEYGEEISFFLVEIEVTCVYVV